MFGRGNWAVMGVRKTSLKQFRQNLNSDVLMLEHSQLRASLDAKFKKQTSWGVNPFASPRKDEALTLSNALTRLATYFSKPADVREPLSEGEIELMKEGFGLAEEFELPEFNSSGIEAQYYGFWCVLNEQEDISDPASKKESIAYKEASRPFKFLNKEEKLGVEQAVTVSAMVARKQFPVLVDFADEKVYVASANEGDIAIAQGILVGLGAELFPVAWQFGHYDWPARLLNCINKETKFESEMAARAEELTRFRPEEIEKLDDRVMEGVVSSFFALTELPTGQWAGLTTPTRIRLYKPTDPASVSNVSTAFSLLRITEEAEVASAAVVFQSLESKFNKKRDEEKQYRLDLFTLDINDKLNLGEVGAALMRGFDLPQFKKEIKAAVKAQQSPLSVAEFWKKWLAAMRLALYTFVENVNELLELNAAEGGLLPYAAEEVKAESVEVGG